MVINKLGINYQIYTRYLYRLHTYLMQIILENQKMIDYYNITYIKNYKPAV